MVGEKTDTEFQISERILYEQRKGGKGFSESHGDYKEASGRISGGISGPGQ